MSMNKLFAIVGMCGSGKSIACDSLRSRGWNYIRFGQITIDRLKETGKEINEVNEKSMRENLRKDHGMGAFAILSLPKIERELASGNVVIDGLYSWTEYKILKEKFGERLSIVCIYASPSTRYARLSNRSTHESDTDTRMRRLSPVEAEKRDYAEIENIEKGGPIAMADYTIINESSEESLKADIERITHGN
jgi:dephospho-CoA kinase